MQQTQKPANKCKGAKRVLKIRQEVKDIINEEAKGEKVSDLNRKK